MMPRQTPEDMEQLISSYLDGELTQAESQRVRLLLEDHKEYRKVYEEMAKLQRLTHSLAMPNPPDARMEAIEKSISVSASRRIGFYAFWGGLGMWLVYLAVLFAKNLRMPNIPEALAGIVVFGLVSLFLSVVVQRWQEMPHDRYRRIRK
jgi:anti-sigma factor RsiW